MPEKVIPKPDFLDQEAWNNLIATRDPKVIAAVAKLHVQQYIDAKGEGDVYLTQGAPTCLVTSIGRKTGNEVVSPVNFMQDGDDVYVVGSIAGLEKHPNWALNLDAKPEGWVQIKARKYPPAWTGSSVKTARLCGLASSSTSRSGATSRSTATGSSWSSASHPWRSSRG